jgi:AcrR family transcriptional regulator
MSAPVFDNVYSRVLDRVSRRDMTKPGVLRGPAAHSAILAAARDLLSRDQPDFPGMEAIAAAAGVTRMTIYNHFTSRAALIDAVLSDVVGRAEMDRLVDRGAALPARDALVAAIDTTARFWNAERPLLKRLFLPSPEEPAVTATLRRREGWRYQQFHIILGRLLPAPAREGLTATTGAVVALTSFPTYEQIITYAADAATARTTMLRAALTALPQDPGDSS